MIGKMILGATAAALSLGAMQVSAAEASSRRGHFRPVLIISTSNYDHDCGYYRWKWRNTGAFFWKKRYFECRGIW
jgi:hypothetical protein